MKETKDVISFVGAGPGDIDLITIKGRKLLKQADIVIYAGSLVSKEHLNYCKAGCRFYNSASMDLEQVIKIMVEGWEKGSKIIRLHTGDPSIYGAIREQIDRLDEKGIPYEVIPGVSSFTAACCQIKREFTLPGVSQTIILTRLEGRTPVPEKEDLEKLASYGASMAIFLSVQNINKVVEELKKGYKREDVPAAVIYKATWDDEKIIKGTLKDIAEKVKGEGIKGTSQILIGDFLGEPEYGRSKLYDPNFSHSFREGI